MEYKEQIGKVERTMLGTEDHGILTAYVFMDFGGSGQGFGGYAFDSLIKHTPYKDSGYSDGEQPEWIRVGSAYGMEWIRRVMLAFGVDQWEDLPGRTAFVLRESDFGTIKGIRPLPTEPGTEFIVDDLKVLVDE